MPKSTKPKPGELNLKTARERLAAVGDVVSQSALTRYVAKYADEAPASLVKSPAPR